MSSPTTPAALPHPLRALASRVGHDAVWLLIAGLFCVVEGAVKVTEIVPGKFRRPQARAIAPVTIKFSPLASSGPRAFVR